MNEKHYIKKVFPFAEFRFSTDSGLHYKTHIHETFSVGAIDKGEVIYNTEGRSAKLQPGSLALINPEVPHACNPIEFGKRSYSILHLEVEWCLQVQKSLWEIKVFRPADIVLLEDEAVYKQYMHTMHLLIAERDLLKKEQLLVDLAVSIFLKACKPSEKKVEPSLHIEELKRQLSLNLDTEISMRDIALKLEANPYTLLRQFKKATGLTPHAYRLNCRIELAKRLLQQGIDLSEVALECGFFDQSHFHRHFKAITTMTPGKYQLNFIQ